MKPTRLSPARTLLLVLLINLAAWAAAILYAGSQPWLGLSLSADEQGVHVTAATGPGAAIPAGARLLAITGAGERIALTPRDLVEEPDIFDSYAEMDAFFQRQGRIAALLEGPTRLEWIGPDGVAGDSAITPTPRPIGSLPAVFWFQLFAGAAGCLVACWVWVLRPRDWGARMFAATGVMFPVFAFPAAIYSTRELALPENAFFALSVLNHCGAFLFGAALIGIFLSYPRLLMPPRHLIWPPLLFGLIWLSDATRLAPTPDWGHRMPVLAEMLLAMLLAGVQWRKSRNAPVDRAALRWFILSTLVGCGLFVFLIVGGAVLGWLPPLPQGYAFGFFLIMYAGLALGLRRYRLFELDEWAYRILLWVGGALAVIGLDALLITALHLESGPSLGLSLLACGWLYFPARQWLWRRIGERGHASIQELAPDLVGIAFTPARAEREARWGALLQRLYDPLEIVVEEENGSAHTTLGDDGLSMRVPSAGGLSARTLRFPARGGRLFSPREITFMDALRQLLDHAEAGRDAYDRGATQERSRIARDMHDDVGARLLMLIHRADTPELAEVARAAMRDLRTALAALDIQPAALADAIADWRAEIAERCEAAGVELVWREPAQLPARQFTSHQKATLERALREAVTNALKHAAPTLLRVELRLDDAEQLHLSVTDDGRSPPPESWLEGRGLRNMRRRIEEIGGALAVAPLPEGGTRLALGISLQQHG